MSQVYVSMAMSLDGFITGPHDDAQNPAGLNGMRLMDWLGGGDASGVDAIRPHDHHNGVPIFVPTHQAPTENPFEQVHYVTDAGCSTPSRSSSGLCCSARAGDSSTTFPLSTSNSTWSARSKRPRPCTCATRSETRD